MRIALTASLAAAALALVPARAVDVGAEGSAAATPSDPAEIRKEMTRLRRTTDWTDAQAAARANARMGELSKALLRASPRGGSASGGGAPATPAADAPFDPDQRATMLQRVVELGGKPRGSDYTAAAPIADWLDEEEAAEKAREAKGLPLDQPTALVLDLSTPDGRALVEKLDQFRSVTLLVLTGGRTGAPVDLRAVLAKASGLPLEELAIVGFRGRVKALPPAIAAFQGLQRLRLVDNRIAELPPSLGDLERLTVLELDKNPVSGVEPVVTRLAALRQLGLAETKVDGAELERIREKLPGCEVLDR